MTLPSNWNLEVGQLRQIRADYKFRPSEKFLVAHVREEVRGEGDSMWISKWVVCIFPDGTRENLDQLWVRSCSEVLDD